MTAESNLNRTAPAPEPDEFYMEGPYIVFTAAYHLRRGWCCKSACRHCPWGFGKIEDPADISALQPNPREVH
jgi:hypothetical protein